MKPRIGRSLFFGVSASLLSLGIAVLIGEFALRATGNSPTEAGSGNRWAMEPDEGFFVYSERRGYEYGPGRFIVTFDSGHRFSITHDDDGLRATPDAGSAHEGCPTETRTVTAKDQPVWPCTRGRSTGRSAGPCRSARPRTPRGDRR